MSDLEALPPLAGEGSLEEVVQPMHPHPHPPPVNPDPSAISAENWQVAEKATQDVLQRIQPTLASERRRRAIAEYVGKLLNICIGTEALLFGSVSLKTYLPDGDIDLTSIGHPNSEDAMANHVWYYLGREQTEQYNDAEFEVMDVQYIDAEVKLVKCLVENIVVDISFNQIGGLSTTCFLEKVDKKIGKDHLFKHSIILIKAWCYYESRILGARHGLISSYALEILVLNVFHLFHKSLDGPLAVLYRFLEFYSKFEWDKYCVSLQGLISVSSLPELLVADMPDYFNGSDLLFSKEFIEECVNLFSAPLRLSATSSKVFLKKHLNIVDPLRQDSNIGRSVSKGNFYRIRSAFTYGAQQLCRISKLPMENIVSEVGTFFTSTLERHKSTGERTDVLSSSFPNSEFIQGTSRDLSLGLDSEARESASLVALSSSAIESPTASPSHHIESPTELLGTGKSSFKTNSTSESTHTIHGYSNLSEQSIHADCSNEGDGKTRNSEFSKLSDFTVEFDVHYRNLQHALRLMDQYNMHFHSMLHMATNNLVPASPYSPTAYSTNQSLIHHGAAHCATDVQKRGTGAYIPDPNSRAYREKQPLWKGKNPTSSRSRSCDDSRLDGQQDRNLLEEGNDESLSRSMSPLSDAPQNSRPGFRGIQLDGKLQFGSFGSVPRRVFSEQSSRHEIANQNNATAIAEPTNRRPSTSSNIQFGKITKPSYQLKDEGDFPPLSG